jgi:hypothetical protein
LAEMNREERPRRGRCHWNERRAATHRKGDRLNDDPRSHMIGYSDERNRGRRNDSGVDRREWPVARWGSVTATPRVLEFTLAFGTPGCILSPENRSTYESEINEGGGSPEQPRTFPLTFHASRMGRGGSEGTVGSSGGRIEEGFSGRSRTCRFSICCDATFASRSSP